MDKVVLVQVFSKYFTFLVLSLFINCSTFINLTITDTIQFQYWLSLNDKINGGRLESVKTKQMLKNYLAAKWNGHVIILVKCKITGLVLITTTECNEAEINLEECLSFQYCTLLLSLPIP